MRNMDITPNGNKKPGACDTLNVSDVRMSNRVDGGEVKLGAQRIFSGRNIVGRNWQERVGGEQELGGTGGCRIMT